MKKIIYSSFFLGFILILTSCKQEGLLFYPDKLPPDYKFHFEGKYQEYNFKVDEKTNLNGLLFKTDTSKGLIFYLHGNAGCIDSWGNCAGIYTSNKFDFFILDYRGYGKSQGAISSEKQLFNDIRIVYDSLKSIYDEKKIIVIGYSIGTGLAAQLASETNPKILVLKAPYYNLPDLVHNLFSKLIPSFIIRYKLRTNEYITKVKCL
ncbi:MAG: alpha/beta fold hydrolase [Bacteroidota bacterium]|nr:alpha/beta fold hydrolase [Bacteroidota bacterium]